MDKPALDAILETARTMEEVYTKAGPYTRAIVETGIDIEHLCNRTKDLVSSLLLENSSEEEREKASHSATHLMLNHIIELAERLSSRMPCQKDEDQSVH